MTEADQSRLEILAYKAEIQERKIEAQHQQISELRRDLHTYIKDKGKTERNQLTAGVIFLGGTIISLIVYIWMTTMGGRP